MLFITLDYPCRSTLSGWRQWLPLTLTSPRCGERGRALRDVGGERRGRGISPSPRARGSEGRVETSGSTQA
ncbi:hypothetical protein RPHASCH2410_CH11670 [Rhizobium phaseoli Ch24-10]|nr:hypothetical protein RPHASCH2410_CH11670 [Rhizobium phaseoli Ch24-10]